MTGLTEHKAAALDAYMALMAERPALFGDRTLRPIVRDREVLAAFAAEHDVVLGVAVDTPYTLFIVDLVESRLPDAGVHRYPYQRVVYKAQLQGAVNTAVLATIENPSLGARGSIVLVEQERHALGASETEIPRGFGELHLSGEANALRELEEETGYTGDHAQFLGTLNTDSGMTDAKVSFYHVPVTGRKAARPEREEAIRKVRLATQQQIWIGVQSGEIRDSFTLQALALYEKHLTLPSSKE